MTAGSEFLPANPKRAIAMAREYALLNGVKPCEIVSAAVSADDRAITLDVRRGLPFYLSGAAFGRLSRWISAEGSARVVQAARNGRGVQV